MVSERYEPSPLLSRLSRLFVRKPKTHEALNSIRNLAGLRVLDIGASPHGYALERCLTLSASEYVGIGLDVEDEIDLRTPEAHASLAYMNAQSLSFRDEDFDVIVTMSTFEHINDVRQALSEFRRVLKPAGCILITFEPIWTCSYGHHLHHFGEIASLVPDWAHLFWNQEEMARYLRLAWPDDAPLSVDEACDWVYKGQGLNRVGITEMREILTTCGMHVEWIIPMPDAARNEAELRAASEKTGLAPDDLMTKGLSALLYKH